MVGQCTLPFKKGGLINLLQVSSESSRRALGNTPGVGNSGRAHPSLAKMRENLINGTIDFQEVPIVDMNPEDIRVMEKMGREN